MPSHDDIEVLEVGGESPFSNVLCRVIALGPSYALQVLQCLLGCIIGRLFADECSTLQRPSDSHASRFSYKKQSSGSRVI